MLSLTTAVAEAAVQPGPAPTAQQGAVGAALAAAVTAGGTPASAASATAAVTGRGQVPAGAALAANATLPATGAAAAASKAAAGAAAAAGGGTSNASAAGGGSASLSSMYSSTGARTLNRSASSIKATLGGVGSASWSAARSSRMMSGGYNAAQQQQQPGDGVLPQAVVDYLMPPQEVSEEIDSQVRTGLTLIQNKPASIAWSWQLVYHTQSEKYHLSHSIREVPCS